MPSILPKAVRDLTRELQHLPAIGPKTAQRLAIYLLRQPPSVVGRFAHTLQQLHSSVHTCQECFSLSEGPLCAICQDSARNRNILCVVEDPLDVEAIERTGSYLGLYHVLGGVLSPIDGVGQEQLTLDQLFARVDRSGITEVIIGLDPNMEGEATARYIVSQLKEKPVTLSRLARGLPTGGDIEFADSLTLHAAFEGRKKLQSPS
jgi:recombination protein RecR